MGFIWLNRQRHICHIALHSDKPRIAKQQVLFIYTSTKFIDVQARKGTGRRGVLVLFPSRVADLPHLSTRQYARIVRRWVASIGLDVVAYGTHTMRRTKATLIYRRTKNLRAVQLLLGHTKLESTVRYLGIEVDDALEIAEQTEA
jgi:integrase